MTAEILDVEVKFPGIHVEPDLKLQLQTNRMSRAFCGKDGGDSTVKDGYPQLLIAIWKAVWCKEIQGGCCCGEGLQGCAAGEIISSTKITLLWKLHQWWKLE